MSEATHLFRPSASNFPFYFDLMTFYFESVPAGKSSIEYNFLETKSAGFTGGMHFSLDINEDEARRLVVPSGMAGCGNQCAVYGGQEWTALCLVRAEQRQVY